MRKIKNTPRYLENNTQYDFAYTKTDGQKLDKSFWQRMSGKAKLSLIATILQFFKCPLSQSVYVGISCWNVAFPVSIPCL